MGARQDRNVAVAEFGRLLFGCLNEQTTSTASREAASAMIVTQLLPHLTGAALQRATRDLKKRLRAEGIDPATFGVTL